MSATVLAFDRPWHPSCLPRCPRRPNEHMAIRVANGLVRCVWCEQEGHTASPIPVDSAGRQVAP